MTYAMEMHDEAFKVNPELLIGKTPLLVVSEAAASAIAADADDEIAALAAELEAAGCVQTTDGPRWPFYLADGKVMLLTVDKWIVARKAAAEAIADRAAENAKLRAALEEIVAGVPTIGGAPDDDEHGKGYDEGYCDAKEDSANVARAALEVA